MGDRRGQVTLELAWFLSITGGRPHVGIFLERFFLACLFARYDFLRVSCLVSCLFSDGSIASSRRGLKSRNKHSQRKTPRRQNLEVLRFVAILALRLGIGGTNKCEKMLYTNRCSGIFDRRELCTLQYKGAFF